MSDRAISGSALTITDAALARVRELAGANARRLRVSVEGGGCSGFRYGFALVDDEAADDFVLDCDDVRVLVDRLSLPYLAGASVDCVEQLAGAQFVIRNPNAKTTCGCGSSFTA
ncbi:MAG TPA: iron-sulfur cluster insertion protein ErpA [Rhodanobacteraceae bacterium]|nr:iron-sulfur cluster insertion protein ErpA [Rhodanobacteraceae bacterium]